MATVSDSMTQLQNQLVKLQQNLREVDRLLIKQTSNRQQRVKLTDEDLQNWYLQHLLVRTIRAFANQKELTIPKYIGRWAFCFGNDNEAMNQIWRLLITKANADTGVLQPAFKQLRQMLSTQMVPTVVTDEVTQWRLRPQDPVKVSLGQK